MESYQQSHQPVQFPTSNNDHENLSSLCDDLDSFLQELSFDDHSPALNGTTTITTTINDNLPSESQTSRHQEDHPVSTYGENFTVNHDYYSDDDQHKLGTSASSEAKTDSTSSSNSQSHETMNGHLHKLGTNDSVGHNGSDITGDIDTTIPTPTSPIPQASSSAPLQSTQLSRSTSNTTSLSSSSDTSSIRSSPLLAPSPSLLGVSRSSSLASNNMNTVDQLQQHQVSVDKNTAVLTPRTSSLTRELALNAKRSDSISSNHSQYSVGSMYNSLSPGLSPRMNSTPGSPLARIAESDPHPSIHEIMYSSRDSGGDDNNDTMTFPNYALLSELATHFVDQVKLVTKRRRIFTTAEYPTSFNGEEAVDIVRSILPTGLPSGFYLKITRALMHSSPPVICPYTYSEKSARRNTLYQTNHEVYLLMENEIPQGVYTPLTRCYTHFCLPGQGGCYAPCCPNKPESQKLKQNGLERHGSLSSSVASSHDTTMSRAWSATVAKDVLKNTPPQEIARQEAIHELIYTEEDYVRDLNLLDELFAKSLRDAQCIEVERRDAFCDNVFNNYLELLTIHKELCRDLQDHQSLCQANNASGFVDQIGDIFLYHLPRFMDAYERYGPHVVLSEYAVKKEMANNILFQNFVHEREKQAETRKLPFRHFIILPVTRLQRYPLLIGAILKKTKDDHPDKSTLTKCSELLRQIASAMDEGTVGSKNTLRVYEINDRIRYKATEPHDLQLLTPGRVLLHEGPLTRRNHMVVESTEIYTFLFDHMLVMTRRKRMHGNNNNNISDDDCEYLISKRPIPMPLLHLEEATEGFSLGMRSMSTTYSNTLTSHTGTLVSSTSFGSNNHPLLLHHLGRSGGDYLLFAENAQVRLAWKEKVVEAKASFEQRDLCQQVFEIRSLSDTTFRGSGGQVQYGKVTCSVQFEGSNGIRMIAVGTVAGVWMGIEGDTNSIRQVLALPDVTQMAVITEPHILMILADKTLYAYALEALDPTSMKKSNDKPNQKVAQSISYFNAGTCQGRPLVIAMKKRGLDSHFKAYEPVCGDLRDPASSKFLVMKTGLFSKTPSWFKVYKEFYVGADSSAVHFLKARIVVVCPRGFEVIDLENLTMNRNLPDIQHPDFAFVQQPADLKPLGLIKCRQHYLLCYDAFAFLVDTHGSFVQESYSWIAWEGKPHAIAFYYPYVLAFDSSFIEIRHVETGELVQILAGVHMRCLQFTNDTFSPVIHGCMIHPFKPEYQYVFQLMANFEPPSLDYYTH
ncbi:CNH domain-domain-containing protein [Absidia repens]|uniref:CNH domain-domain-containing protein n=1 Tax=Absidia repens TaxID=90262 RepID=A0A1X2HZF7_9FUNG|nr:CNH domain-domain-containing protein [Absidia repens]